MILSPSYRTSTMTLVQRHKDMAVEEVIARMQKPLNWLQRFGKRLFRL